MSRVCRFCRSSWNLKLRAAAASGHPPKKRRIVYVPNPPPHAPPATDAPLGLPDSDRRARSSALYLASARQRVSAQQLRRRRGERVHVVLQRVRAYAPGRRLGLLCGLRRPARRERVGSRATRAAVRSSSALWLPALRASAPRVLPLASCPLRAPCATALGIAAGALGRPCSRLLAPARNDRRHRQMLLRATRSS